MNMLRCCRVADRASGSNQRMQRQGAGPPAECQAEKESLPLVGRSYCVSARTDLPEARGSRCSPWPRSGPGPVHAADQHDRRLEHADPGRRTTRCRGRCAGEPTSEQAVQCRQRIESGDGALRARGAGVHGSAPSSSGRPAGGGSGRRGRAAVEGQGGEHSPGGEHAGRPPERDRVACTWASPTSAGAGRPPAISRGLRWPAGSPAAALAATC